MFFKAASSIFIYSRWLLCCTTLIQTAQGVWIARSSQTKHTQVVCNDSHQSNFVSIRDRVNVCYHLLWLSFEGSHSLPSCNAEKKAFSSFLFLFSYIHFMITICNNWNLTELTFRNRFIAKKRKKVMGEHTMRGHQNMISFWRWYLQGQKDNVMSIQIRLIQQQPFVLIDTDWHFIHCLYLSGFDGSQFKRSSF